MADNFRVNTSYDEEMRKFDPYAHAVTVIEENHRMIHDGFMFSASAQDVAVANGAKFYMLLQVPAGVFPHLQIFEIAADGGPLTYDLHEGTTFSAAGTAITAYNRNRNSSNTLQTTLTYDPTVTIEGTAIDEHYVPTAGTGKTGVIDTTQWGEFVLAQNTNYLIGVHNDSGQARNIQMLIGLYEIGYDQ